MTLHDKQNRQDTESFRTFLNEANRYADEPLVDVLNWLQRKEKELKSCKSSEKSYFAEEKEKEKFCKKMFNKPSREVNSAELHELCVEVMRSLYINRRNCSQTFLQAVQLIFEHPLTNVVDQENLRGAFKLFKLESDKLFTGPRFSTNILVSSCLRPALSGFEHK